MREKFLSFLGLLLVIFAASAMELEIVKGGNGTFQYGAVSTSNGLLHYRRSLSGCCPKIMCCRKVRSLPPPDLNGRSRTG